MKTFMIEYYQIRSHKHETGRKMCVNRLETQEVHYKIANISNQDCRKKKSAAVSWHNFELSSMDQAVIILVPLRLLPAHEAYRLVSW